MVTKWRFFFFLSICSLFNTNSRINRDYSIPPCFPRNDTLIFLRVHTKFTRAPSNSFSRLFYVLTGDKSKGKQVRNERSFQRGPLRVGTGAEALSRSFVFRVNNFQKGTESTKNRATSGETWVSITWGRERESEGERTCHSPLVFPLILPRRIKKENKKKEGWSFEFTIQTELQGNQSISIFLFLQRLHETLTVASTNVLHLPDRTCSTTSSRKPKLCRPSETFYASLRAKLGHRRRNATPTRDLLLETFDAA